LLFFIGFIALGVALLWFIPIMYDVWQTNRWRRTQQTSLLSILIGAVAGGTEQPAPRRRLPLGRRPANPTAEIAHDPSNPAGQTGADGQAGNGTPRTFSVEEIRQIVSAVDRAPRGAAGLTQSLIALVVVTLVGVALVASLVTTSQDGGDLRMTIITSLVSILATIAGFYFGARTAQASTEQATQPPPATARPSGNTQSGSSGPQPLPSATGGVQPSSSATGGAQPSSTGTGGADPSSTGTGGAEPSSTATGGADPSSAGTTTVVPPPA
jgi:hypothetical protein